jgi:hypothetical protein
LLLNFFWELNVDKSKIHACFSKKYF